MDGLAIARERIAREAEAQTGVLDLGGLGLSELPEELFALKHLRSLNLGSTSRQARDHRISWRKPAEANRLGRQANRLFELTSLEELDLEWTDKESLAGIEGLPNLHTLDCSNTQLSNLAPLSALTNLQTLNCARTEVSDLADVGGLTTLQTFDCSDTQVSDLEPLAALANLETLFCSNTEVSDLAPLAALANLKTLHCSITQVRDLTPLATLANLETLFCSSTQVNDLAPLATLANLDTLFCSNTQVSDLAPLAALANLQRLFCFDTQVSDLEPLSALANLQILDCSNTQVSNLAPIAELDNLQTLDFFDTQVKDLAPLTALVHLQTLDCSGTQVNDLAPLAALTNLQTLHCYNTQVSDLAPLAALANLKTLFCSNTQVSDLAPLAALANLQTLHCSDTKVSDLAPLTKLTNLQTLTCSRCRLKRAPESIWFAASLNTLHLHETALPGVPPEVLSQASNDNCLESLRAHLRDLEAGEEPISDIKLMVLGNGRIGKTQICRRLRGEPYDAKVDSTHGIFVNTAELTYDDRSTVRLNIWDFGGQDIYHGTHALFMRSHSAFLLVWTPGFEDTAEHAHGGLVFRNQPLVYWLDYIRKFGGDDSPVVITQARCDSWKEEKLRPPASDSILNRFVFPPRIVRYSSRTDYGRASLDESLKQVVSYLKEQSGTTVIGAGRAKVKRQIEVLRDKDAKLPILERQNRTISHVVFENFCKEAGIDNPDPLLAYLHNAGTLFYRKGLFHDHIIIDQNWALEAIYAVFHREKCFVKIRRLHGRFTRSDLADWIWNEAGYGEKEQQLFISMMESCGICFVHREAVPEKRIEAEYIAPDLLPDRTETEIDQKWDAGWPSESVEFRYDLLPTFLTRAIISRIGRDAGLSADYWRDGVYVYEADTGSRALVAQRRDASGFGGSIIIQTQRGRASALLARLTKLVELEQQRLGISSTTTGQRPIHAEECPDDPTKHTQTIRAEPLNFTQEPTKQPEYFVSYAWGDNTADGRNRETVVDDLCAAAEARGITILRDKKMLTVGDRITKFMTRLGRGNRVFIVLSQKYLQSPYCMYELAAVWRNSRQDDDEFLKRIRVYALDDAKIWTPTDRAQCAVFWRKQSNELEQILKDHGPDVLGDRDFDRYRLMKEFAHQIGDILSTITDILQPRTFEELKQYGLADLPDEQPSLAQH
ncbi:leucine-rich repeat domain-containing protein [Rhodopseudomonas sp. BR0G17]|uniref:leucine-rich repeat domain-containing protein n=1 Tax=Rhodopseudomonas sp. BR0G17 TaxID=2269368 RepID=UPI0013DF4A61|nr:leucine-rich repeat domain-containing protein [Rhodopseudomonas sp. BR0G17]NEW99350.1 TIR domain-containing protein [Rhodopseudomonas sp. BR0G17]